jgi:hypothetical protein
VDWLHVSQASIRIRTLQGGLSRNKVAVLEGAAGSPPFNLSKRLIKKYDNRVQNVFDRTPKTHVFAWSVGMGNLFK